MQTEAIAGGAVPSGTVHGLGVCDALRLELQPVQLPWLIDELEEMRGPLEEELQRLRGACACGEGDRNELEEREYELRLLRMLRAQLPVGRQEGLVEFVGPSGVVGEVALNTMRYVVDALSDLVHAKPARDHQTAASLRDTAAAAHAWVRTVLDCRAVEAFNFDLGADPVAPW